MVAESTLERLQSVANALKGDAWGNLSDASHALEWAHYGLLTMHSKELKGGVTGHLSLNQLKLVAVTWWM